MPEMEEEQKSNEEALVAVVVVHYQCIEDTLRCVSSLFKLDYENFFTVVVDSASADGSGAKLQSLLSDPSCRVILSPDNSGFAAATNIGIRYAQAAEADFVWLLNPDTEVETGALSALIQRAEEKGPRAAFGSKILYGYSVNESAGDSSPKIWGAGGNIDFSAQQVEMYASGEIDSGQCEQLKECGYLPGCSLLVSKHVLDEVGLLPEHYFMYFEETDWCVRMREQGIALWYVPESIVWHYFDDSKMQDPFGVYYYNRNSRIFWSRYCSPKQRVKRWLKTLLRELPQSVRALFHSPDEHHAKIFRAHISSQIDYLLGRQGKRTSFLK